MQGSQTTQYAPRLRAQLVYVTPTAAIAAAKVECLMR